MRTHRTLRLRKEVLTELSDGDLESVVGAEALATLPIRHCWSVVIWSCVESCVTCLSCPGTCE